MSSVVWSSFEATKDRLSGLVQTPNCPIVEEDGGQIYGVVDGFSVCAPFRDVTVEAKGEEWLANGSPCSQQWRPWSDNIEKMWMDQSLTREPMRQVVQTVTMQLIGRLIRE